MFYGKLDLSPDTQHCRGLAFQLKLFQPLTAKHICHVLQKRKRGENEFNKPDRRPYTDHSNCTNNLGSHSKSQSFFSCIVLITKLCVCVSQSNLCRKLPKKMKKKKKKLQATGDGWLSRPHFSTKLMRLSIQRHEKGCRG